METWKDVVGFEGKYAVSDKGRIKGLRREKMQSHGVLIVLKEKERKPVVNRCGYLCLNLNDGPSGKLQSKKVHRLVAEAFIENPKNHKEVNHIDGNKLNNRKENLAWCSRSENIKHSFETGLRSHKGENHPSNKLKDSDILKIRELFSQGETQTAIAKTYNVSQVLIGRIVNKKAWNHID
jgi:hypothetical protein